MYKLPYLPQEDILHTYNYVMQEGFINVTGVKTDPSDLILTFHMRDNINEYITLPRRVVVDLYNIILEYGYMGFLDLTRTAIEYFSSYNDDYVSTVLDKMDDKGLKTQVSSDKLLNYVKMVCYYYRVSEHKAVIRRFVNLIEITYL